MNIQGNILSYTATLLLFLTTCSGYNSTCDVNTYVDVAYQFSNPGYPNYYPKSTSCRWYLRTAANKRINVQCNNVEIYQDASCTDKLVVSYNGDFELKDGVVYCGSGTMNLLSNANAITVATISKVSNWRINCIAYAIASTQPTPQPTTKPPETCDCGWKQQHRIVGGEETGINEFPFMAAVVRLDYRDIWCGAVIISPKHVLTAAHCVVNIQSVNLRVLIGDHNTVLANETKSSLEAVSFVNIHEYYNSKTNENDIAVLTLFSVLVFSLKVAPVCLPFLYKNFDATSQKVTVLGWGTTEFTGPRSDYLQEANLTVVSNAYCQNMWSGKANIYSSNICTYEPGKDACQFDSGGPIIFWDWLSERYQLFGLVSYGAGCGSNYPGINTRVASFMDWILNITRDYKLCAK